MGTMAVRGAVKVGAITIMFVVLSASAAAEPFAPVLIHSGKNTDPAVFAKELAVFRDAVPIYPIADYSVNPKQRLTPFRKHDEYKKYYVQTIPDDMRRKTPYGIVDLFGSPRVTVDSDYARSGKPFFVYERISRPPFFLPGDGCPLADRAAYAEWKKSHPGFLGFASLWELDSDSTYLARYYDKIVDESARKALHSAFRRPDEKGMSYRFDWAKEAFRRAKDFHFGEGAVWPMCSNFMGYEHFFGALGAAGLWYEATSQHFGAWNAAAAFLRGAARQRGLDYGWYMAQYYSGFNRKGEHLVGDSLWKEKTAGASGNCRYRGESRSLHRRQVAYGWLIGAKYIEMEGWKLIYTDEAEGKLVPTENARDFNEVYELACRVDRGEPFTPLAVLTPLAEPCSTLYHNEDLLDPDSQKAIFDTLVPIRGHNGEKIPKRNKGQQGCLYNSEFAGFFDSLCPDSGQDSAAFAKALSRYSHVVVAGDAFDKEKFDHAALAAFEKGGGKVHRYPSPECPTKEKLRELLLKIQDETMPVKVQGDIQWGVNKTSNGWLVYLINNKGVIKFCDEPEEFDMSKTAHVIVTVKGTGERREVDIAPGDFKLCSF